MARVADHVYDHVLAVCRSAPHARPAAVSVLARAPRSLPGALALARVAAIEAAGNTGRDGGGDGGADPAGRVPGGVLELVWMLAARRPIDERSVVDLATRHGLDRVGLGRALGRVPGRAGADADAVLDRWETAFRPVLVGFLGPGECEGLRTVLADTGGFGELEVPETDDPDGFGEWDGPGTTHVTERGGEATVDALLDAAPAVAGHLERCDVCRDRVRAMASVRALLAQVPIVSAPPGLQPPTWRGRPLRPTPASDGDASGGASGRRRRTARLLATAGTTIALGVGAALVLVDGDGDDRIARLTRVPLRNALAAVPDEVRPGQVFLLQSTVDRAVRWRVRVAADAPWLRVDPASGVLSPRGTNEVEVRLDDSAPEGELRVDLTVTADDGSTLLVRLRGSVEHAPTVAAVAEGCAVTAHVEDETDIAAVELHWRSDDGTTARRAMPPLEAGYAALVPDAAVPARWWITAVDGRGNRARSPEHAVTAC